ncbi:unnamed protein product [Somion occarium]|uniref:Uncharacterized protein n=1 Tax=Somion occarium TaxID=3059160 RepID=A0ABP1DV73_9APHY
MLYDHGYTECFVRWRLAALHLLPSSSPESGSFDCEMSKRRLSEVSKGDLVRRFTMYDCLCLLKKERFKMHLSFRTPLSRGYPLKR